MDQQYTHDDLKNKTLTNLKKIVTEKNIKWNARWKAANKEEIIDKILDAQTKPSPSTPPIVEEEEDVSPYDLLKLKIKDVHDELQSYPLEQQQELLSPYFSLTQAASIPVVGYRDIDDILREIEKDKPVESISQLPEIQRNIQKCLGLI